MKKQSLLILVLIALFGLGLRLVDYDRIPPFLETKDEFFYPWAGISFLQTGTPVAWANFSAYSESQTVTLWGESFRLVKPWIEKPPLYWLVSGGLSLLAGENEFYEVRLSTARLLPIFLNFIAIILLGLLVEVVYGKKTSVISTLFYATVPTIVLANRLNLTENLLIPISLFTLYVYFIDFPEKFKNWQMPLVGFSCAAALLTKNIGMALPLVILLDLISQKKWRDLIVVGTFSFIGGAVHPLMGYIYNWNLYTNVLNEYRLSHALGLPETIASIFLYPVIGHKEKIILDGGMLAGYLAFFATLLKSNVQSRQHAVLLAFPTVYLTILAFLEGGRTWFGWHLFPLYPYLMIFLADVFIKVLEKPEYLKFLIFYLIWGASTLRFAILIFELSTQMWQYILVEEFVILSFPFVLKNIIWEKAAVKFLISLLILINILAIIKSGSWYESKIQPQQAPLTIQITSAKSDFE